MLAVGERLFALHGVDGVSLRQVGAAAGQRNVAAAQYHFGDRQGLIRAIFEFRLPPIDARRREMLARVREEGRAADVRALTEVLVFPLAEQAKTPGSHYVRFLNRMCDHEGLRVLPLSDVGPIDTAVEAGEMLGELLRDRLGTAGELRGEFAGRLIITCIADLEHRLAVGSADAPDPDAYTDSVVDAVVAMLTGPVLQVRNGPGGGRGDERR